MPYFGAAAGAGERELLADNIQSHDPDEFRQRTSLLDAVSRRVHFSDFGLTVGADVFNVFNKSYILQRQHRLNLATSDNVNEIVGPRIIRLGVRVSFR